MPSSAAVKRAAPAGAGLGADLLAVVARLNRYVTQSIQMPLPAAQARLLATIEDNSDAIAVLRRLLDDSAPGTGPAR
jgi:hypothetical protein